MVKMPSEVQRREAVTEFNKMVDSSHQRWVDYSTETFAVEEIQSSREEKRPEVTLRVDYWHRPVCANQDSTWLHFDHQQGNWFVGPLLVV